MNEIINQLYSRKSCRVFTEEEISTEAVQAILKAAIMAPTAGNQQLYSIINITDQSIKEKLSISCDNQPFIANGKLVLIFCSDLKRWYDAYKLTEIVPREPMAGDFLLSLMDVAVAAQNAVVAAESLGIGSCYIGDIMERYEYHKELLNLPDYVFPAVMLVFGYPTEGQKLRQKPERIDMDYICSENRYRALNEQDLAEIFKKKSGSEDYIQWLEAFCKRKYHSSFSLELSRSVQVFLDRLGRP